MEIKFIEIPSEIGGNTPGTSLGNTAIKAAAKKRHHISCKAGAP